MNRLTVSIAAMVVAIAAMAQSFDRNTVGVWANDNCELLQTDSIFLFFEHKGDNVISASVAIPLLGLRETTTFVNDSTILREPVPTPFEVSLSDAGTLSVNGQTLRRVEELEFTAPYDMPEALSRNDIGRCLQEWRLGTIVQYDSTSRDIYVEANTNRHSFMYYIVNGMTYLRAAAQRNNDNGTLFFQNIRLMKNPNTGEMTRIIIKDNYSTVKNDLDIDDSRFNPESCYFSPDGGIYWAYLSHTPDCIEIGGCDMTYRIQRRTHESQMLLEWIKYRPYNSNPTLPPPTLKLQTQ